MTDAELIELIRNYINTKNTLDIIINRLEQELEARENNKIPSLEGEEF